MYKVYGTKGTVTCAVVAALTEAGALFESIEIATSRKEHLTKKYRRINPRQQVPSVMLPNGSIMTESAAILLHIADSHPEAKLAPAPGSVKRAQHDRWLIFFAVNVYEGVLREARGERYTTDPNGKQGIEEAAKAYGHRHYRIFEEALEAGPYFFGNDFSMLDIYVWVLAQWQDRSWLQANCPKTVRLVETVKARPMIAPVHGEYFGV